jgi:hypothetical protein
MGLTFDDGPDMADTVRLSPAARNEAILRQLADAHLKSILCVTRVDRDSRRNELIRGGVRRGMELPITLPLTPTLMRPRSKIASAIS